MTIDLIVPTGNDTEEVLRRLLRKAQKDEDDALYRLTRMVSWSIVTLLLMAVAVTSLLIWHITHNHDHLDVEIAGTLTFSQICIAFSFFVLTTTSLIPALYAPAHNSKIVEHLLPQFLFFIERAAWPAAIISALAGTLAAFANYLNDPNTRGIVINAFSILYIVLLVGALFVRPAARNILRNVGRTLFYSFQSLTDFLLAASSGRRHYAERRSSAAP